MQLVTKKNDMVSIYPYHKHIDNVQTWLQQEPLVIIVQIHQKRNGLLLRTVS